MTNRKTAGVGDVLPEEVFSFGSAVGKEWGWVAFRGVITFLFGLLSLIWPLETIWTLAIMWGAFVFVDGIGAIGTAWRLHKCKVRWWPYTILAITGIVAGILALLWPGLTMVVLIYLIAFWAIFGGINQIIAAIRLREEIKGEWVLGLGGAISILFGLVVLVQPIPDGFLMVAWLIGYYAMLAGIFLFILAYRLKNHRPIPV